MTSTTFFLVFIPLLAIILLVVNLLFASHNPYIEKNSAFECGFHSFLGQNRTQFSISFFIFALLFLLFDLEILLVYPYIVSAYTNDIYGLVVTLVFFLVLTLGFAFELGKNALKIDSKQLLKVVSKQLYVKAILGINSPPLPHRFVDSVLQSNKSYFFLFTISSSTISLNISLPNLSTYINTLLDSVYHAAVSNIFTNNTALTNVTDNNEIVITKLYYITNLAATHNMHEFIPKGVHLISYHPLHTALINIIDHPAIILGIFIPLITYLVRVMNRFTDILALNAVLIKGSALYNSKNLFSFSLVTTRRLNTRICSDISKIKGKIFIPNWKLKTLNVFKNSKTDYLNSLVNNIERNFFSYMMPTARQDREYNQRLFAEYRANMTDYRGVHARLSEQVRQLNMRYHYHIVHQGNPDPSNPSTMTGIVTTMQNTQELRNNVVSLTEELTLLRVHLDHLRERALERNLNYNNFFNGHTSLPMIRVIGNQTQLWAFQRDSLEALTENIGVFFVVVGPLTYVPSTPLASRSRTQDHEQGDNEQGGPSKTRKF